MNFNRGRGERVEINLTPLIDVVFLLLIFFMVTTTFDRLSDLKVELPEASAKSELQQDQQLDVVIDADGRYYINGRELVNTKPATVLSALKEASQRHPAAPMIIRADAETPHQAVVTAMDSAAQLGLHRLSIATSRSAKP